MAERNASRPALALEVTAQRILAGRANSGQTALEAAAIRVLPANALMPNLTGSNVHQLGPVQMAVSDVLAAIGARGHDVTLVLPDSAVRVMLLDFDTLPQKEQEVSALVRFRLKKLLPFDADRATVSYQIQRSGTVQVLAAVAQSSVVAEYEAVVREAGFNPGVLLPSILAVLGAVRGDFPTLVVKAESGTTAIAIVDQGQVRLVRAIESINPASAVPARLAEDIYPSLVFFQDTYGTEIRRVLVGGTAASDDLRIALEQQAGLEVQDLVNEVLLPVGAARDSVPRSAFAGVLGALVAT